MGTQPAMVDSANYDETYHTMTIIAHWYSLVLIMYSLFIFKMEIMLSIVEWIFKIELPGKIGSVLCNFAMVHLLVKGQAFFRLKIINIRISDLCIFVWCASDQLT